jgi:FkbM family methyltransferase
LEGQQAAAALPAIPASARTMLGSVAGLAIPAVQLAVRKAKDANLLAWRNALLQLAHFGLSGDTITSELEPHELDALFYSLSAAIGPDVILEIGSRDFMDGLKIKESSPSSTVFAFEANPENFSEYLKNINTSIFPMPIALGESNCMGTIRVPKFASRSQDADPQQRGIASILSRDELGDAIEYEVPMMTLDTFMGNFAQDCASFAMWVDVEGYAFQVISGASEQLMQKCLFAKIEVEDIAYWNDQHLAGDVREFMAKNQFTEVANCDRQLKQYDILFLHNSLL